MEPFVLSLSLCAGNSLVSGEFPSQRPVTRSFDVFFHLCLNKWLSKQSRGWWFETPSCSLWSHCNEHGSDQDRTRIKCWNRKYTLYTILMDELWVVCLEDVGENCITALFICLWANARKTYLHCKYTGVTSFLHKPFDVISSQKFRRPVYPTHAGIMAHAEMSWAVWSLFDSSVIVPMVSWGASVVRK